MFIVTAPPPVADTWNPFPVEEAELVTPAVPIALFRNFPIIEAALVVALLVKKFTALNSAPLNEFPFTSNVTSDW
jgi:hypothetical protein